MKNLVKMAFVAIALLISVAASAQSCVPAPYTMNGGPQRCWGDASGQVTSGQQRIFIPTNLPVGGIFSTSINGVEKRCKLLDRAVSGIAQGVVAGGLGYIVEKVINRKNHDLSAGLFAGGVFVGATITCDPDVMDNFTQRQKNVAQQVPQQQQWQEPAQQQVVAQPQQAQQRPTPKQVVAKLMTTTPLPDEGDFTCPFEADGEKLVVIKTVDRSSCVEWTDTIAKLAGWTRN